MFGSWKSNRTTSFWITKVYIGIFKTEFAEAFVQGHNENFILTIMICYLQYEIIHSLIFGSWKSNYTTSFWGCQECI